MKMKRTPFETTRLPACVPDFPTQHTRKVCDCMDHYKARFLSNPKTVETSQCKPCRFRWREQVAENVPGRRVDLYWWVIAIFDEKRHLVRYDGG